MIESLKKVKNSDFLPKVALSLFENLLLSGVITTDQLHIAKIENSKTGQPLDEILVDLGFLSERLMTETKAKHQQYLYFDPQKTLLDISLLKKFPREEAENFKILPLFISKGSLHVAVCDPEDVRLYDRLKHYYDEELDYTLYIATPSILLETIDRYYGQQLSLSGILQSYDTSQVNSYDQENISVHFLQAVLIEAVKRKASDIHFEPEEKFVRIRYRIDGILFQICAFHHQFWPCLNVRLKILSQMNIAESRLPQDGRFTLNILGREIDLRVSTLPTYYGENIVIRLLDRHYSLRSLEGLGLQKEQCDQIKNLVAQPDGIIIVTGPTGSGKTTTLYSMLQYVSTPSLNIMTLEEPIEYKLPRIRQTEIKASGDFGFVEGVRSLLRQDPDIIFIGEVRDEATAQMALRASMTGHLVFTTFHTQDVFGVFPRLVDLKISPTLLDGNLKAVLSQRLLRKLCPACKQRTIIESRIVFTSQGCEMCQHSGYQGRMSVTEILEITPALDSLIYENVPSSMLKQAAQSQGFQNLRDRASQKVFQGETSWDEVFRVLGKN